MKFPAYFMPGLLLIAALLSLGALSLSQGDSTPATIFYSKPEYRTVLEEWKKLGQVPGEIALLSSHDLHSIWKESTTIGQMIELGADPETWSKDQIRDLSQFILLKSQEYNISPILIVSLIEVESRFRPEALSPKGAMGLMQVMPATAAFLASGDSELSWKGPSDLNDPKVNIEFGLRYVKKLKSQFRKPEHVLTAYNMGPAALNRKLKRGEPIAFTYYQKVMDTMQTYKRATRERKLADGRKKSWL